MTSRALWHDHEIPLWGAILCTACLGAVVISDPAFQVPVLAGTLGVALIAFCRPDIVQSLLVFFVADCLVQVLKRAIYLIGPQPTYLYYAVQILPTLVLGFTGVYLLRLLRVALPKSALILALFVALLVGTTLCSPVDLPWVVRLAAIQQQGLPFLLYFAGLCVPLRKLPRLGKAVAVVAMVSVGYAVVQFVGGPTPLDIAWVNGAGEFSIQAGKVHGFLLGSSTEFRPFSFYADPLTWGLFLLGTIVMVLACRSLRVISRPVHLFALVILLLGLFLTLTRTPWIGLCCTVAVFATLNVRLARRPWLLTMGVLAAFAVVILGGSFLLERFFVPGQLPVFQNAVLSRYLTLGTLSARMSAWDVLVRISSEHWLIGTGLGYGLQYSGRLADFALTEAMESHNFIVELAMYSGLPGLLLFLRFYYLWLREGLSGIRSASCAGEKRALQWIMSFGVGSVITGYFNGPNFLTPLYFLMMGVLAGQRWRGDGLRKQRRTVGQECR